MMGRVYEHLLPGGVFLMEHNTPSDRLPTEEQRRCGMGTGITRRMDPLSPSGTSESTTPAPGVARSLGIYERYVDGRLQDTELHDGTTGLWETEMVSDHLTAAGFVDVVASAPFRDDEPPSSGWVAMRCRRPG
jgi:hypothetical protein